MPRLKVIIPIYRAALKAEEAEALDNNIRRLARRDIVLLKPHGLDISHIEAKYPQAETLGVSTEWLGTKRGIAGYNAMMMSADFYRMFSDTDFILVCHIDAWIFRDDLDRWMAQPVDHVAAPWVTWPIYSHFPFRQLMELRRNIVPETRMLRSDTYGHVGNGGLSLRRVSAFIAACENHAVEARAFIEARNSMHNEDVFFALAATELRTPSVRDAMTFAFDVKPAVCYREIGRQLPMGCHGYRHRSRWGFWKRFIEKHDGEREGNAGQTSR